MSFRPFLAYLGEVRRLKGEPRVTYPDGDVEYPVTERVAGSLRGTARLAFYSPEPDTGNFPNCLLVAQEEVGGDRHNTTMYRRYERLPSRKQWSRVEWDEEAGVDIYRGTWNDRSGVSAPAVGGRINVTIPSGTIANCVVIASTSDVLDQVRAKMTVTACLIPKKRIFRKPRGYQFPALFTPLRGWLFDRDFQFEPPWLGTNYRFTSARTMTVTAREEYTYSLGPTNALPTPFFVTTQAEGSRVFRFLTANTVHPAFSETEIVTFGSGGSKSQIIEQFAASTPATYSPNQILIVEAEETPWRGPIWRQRIVKVKENGNL